MLTVSSGGEQWRLEPRVMRVLCALADAGGSVVSKERLVELCWDGRAVTDDAVQRCIAAIRKVGAAAQPGSFSIETIPRIGYRLIIKPGKPVEPGPETAIAAPVPGRDIGAPAGKHWGRRLAAPAAAALAGAIAFGFGIFVAGAAKQDPAPAVAVAAFEALSTSSDDADALARILPIAISDQLSAIGVPVAAAAGEGTDAARTVGAPTYIIDGAISPGDSGWRLVARIKRARSQEILWTSSFTAPASHPERAPAEVAAALASAFAGPVPLFGKDAEETAHLSEKLRVSELLRALRPVEALVVAERLLKKSSDDVSSLVLFSTAVGESLTTTPDADRARLLAAGREAARRAIALDNRRGDAFLALSALYSPSEYQARIAELEAGIERNPENPSLQSAMATALATVGRTREAELWLSRSIAGDPFSRSNAQKEIILAANKGDVQRVDALLVRARERWPDEDVFVEIDIWLAARFLEPGRLEEALHKAAVPSKAQKDRLALLEDAIRERTPETIAALARHCGARENERAGYLTACAYALAKLGHDQGALAALKIFLGDAAGATALEREAQFLARPWHGAQSAVLFREPFAHLQNDPGMWALFAQAGLVDYWLSANKWPDFCLDKKGPMDCATMAHAVLSGSTVDPGARLVPRSR